ncbi:TatD family hydrolase [bacterium]|nr:TatD family hydrolase [bacterium]
MNIGAIDSHAHLSQADFDPDRDEVISRAKKKGVKAILSIGTSPEEFTSEIALAAKYPGFIYSGLGYHPHIAKDVDDSSYENLKSLILNNKDILAVGEIGLDFYYKHSDPECQEGVFREQLSLAAGVSLPVIIHCRQAYPLLIDILKTVHINPAKVLIHCFSGDTDQAKGLLSWGASLSFAGPVTYPSAEKLRDAVRFTPMDRLLVETDSPYLSPQTFRGKRNEPAYVLHTYERIAQIKGVHTDELKEKVCINFSLMFGIVME